MEIEGDKIRFKSISTFFDKEESDKKNNTIRILNAKDYNKFLREKYNLKYIEIENKFNIDKSFVREISDITEFGNMLGGVLIIITWKPKKLMGDTH